MNKTHTTIHPLDAGLYSIVVPHVQNALYFDKKCTHFSALYYVNALYVFLGSNLSFNW